jgi:hypothetical protein
MTLCLRLMLQRTQSHASAPTAQKKTIKIGVKRKLISAEQLATISRPPTGDLRTDRQAALRPPHLLRRLHHIFQAADMVRSLFATKMLQ